MARINIETSIYSDYRFINLVQKVGDHYKALGLLVAAWTLAQKHYLTEKTSRFIPLTEWNRTPFTILVEVGLARQIGDGIQMCGADEQFAWLIQKQVAGKKGGRPKKEKPGETGRFTGESGCQAQQSGSNPPTPTPPLTLTLNNLEHRKEVCSERLKIVAEPAPKNEQYVIFEINETIKPKIKKDLCKAWSELYSEEFIERELKKAKAWILSNTHKAPKTRYEQFFTSWLSRGWEHERKLLKGNSVAITTDDLITALQK